MPRERVPDPDLERHVPRRAAAGAGASEDLAIVAQLRAGAEDALRQLLLLHGPRVKGTLLREFGLRSEGAVDEALNLAAFRVWRSADRFDPSRGRLRAWFYTIARNELLDVLRKQLIDHWEFRDGDRFDHIARSDAAPTGDPPGDEQNPAEPAYARDLRECIDQLPKLQRAIMMADLRAGGVAEAKALAADHDTTPNTVYVSRNKARRSLRTRMQARGHFTEFRP